MAGTVSPVDLAHIQEMVAEIRELKRMHNAVVLSHYYMAPELQVAASEGGIADFTGDSLGLSIEATRTDADVIVFCGVEFMAETAYILNPGKKVLLPSGEAGCSLASSITGEQVRALKAQYPGVPVIAYINTYAETKAECDVICTSRNALKIAESFDSDTLIFLPDKFMGQNLSGHFNKVGKKLILWNGRCEVHEQFRENIHDIAEAYPQAEVLLHWEVPAETVSQALSTQKGILGSTGDIIRYVGESGGSQFILGSECDLGATLRGMYPAKKFITPCISCRFMKKITLQNTLDALRSIGSVREKDYSIKLDDKLRERAYKPLKRMLELG
jgi:quinolinate synthase